MTADRLPDSFGPYAFTLAPAEADAAAARAGLRTALKGGLLTSHVAPLTAFALVMAFATVLALTDLISRRAGKATFGDEALSFEMDGRTLNLTYADCEQAEDAGGLIYIWPRNGVPIVMPTRAIADADEAARLLSRLSTRIGNRRQPAIAG